MPLPIEVTGGRADAYHFCARDQLPWLHSALWFRRIASIPFRQFNNYSLPFLIDFRDSTSFPEHGCSVMAEKRLRDHADFRIAFENQKTVSRRTDFFPVFSGFCRDVLDLNYVAFSCRHKGYWRYRSQLHLQHHFVRWYGSIQSGRRVNMRPQTHSRSEEEASLETEVHAAFPG